MINLGNDFYLYIGTQKYYLEKTRYQVNTGMGINGIKSYLSRVYLVITKY